MINRNSLMLLQKPKQSNYIDTESTTNAMLSTHAKHLDEDDTPEPSPESVVSSVVPSVGPGVGDGVVSATTH